MLNILIAFMLIGNQSPRLFRKRTEAGGVHWQVERKGTGPKQQNTAEIIAITKCGVVNSLVKQALNDKNTGE